MSDALFRLHQRGKTALDFAQDGDARPKHEGGGQSDEIITLLRESTGKDLLAPRLD